MELYAVHYANEFKYADYRTIYHNDERTELIPGFVFLYYVAVLMSRSGGLSLLFSTSGRPAASISIWSLRPSGLRLIRIF
jgi:hypothetical protein